MPKRTPITTREYLKSVPLPQHATSYTVIEHETVIVNALAQLKLKGFSVESEHYRSTHSGDVAVGTYHLTYEKDPELGMMFAWANSYDKSMRFKCAVGGFVRISNASMVGDDFSWSRKHTGTADQEMIMQVTNQIINAQTYYDNLLLVRDAMKATKVTGTAMAEFFGRAFFEKDLFSKEQIGIVRDQCFKPTYDYNCPDDSLWKYYNHMLVALKQAHPRTWMEEHRDIHKFVVKEFNLPTYGQGILSQIITTTNNVGPATVIQVTPDSGSVSIYTVESEAELSTEASRQLHGVDNNIEVSTPIKEEPAIEDETPVSELKLDSSVPFLEDITEEEQKLIDKRMAMFGTGKTESIDLNLPD